MSKTRFATLIMLVACGTSDADKQMLDAGAGSSGGLDASTSDGRDDASASSDAAAQGDGSPEAGSGDAAHADGATHDGASPSPESGPCTDPCPAPAGGVTLGCEKRFFYGENYAWRNFGTDFGGLAQWGQVGVAAAPAGYLADLKSMQADHANVIRWWLFPDLRGDGITRDGNGVPTGLGPTVLDDVSAALDLADQANVFLQLTFFSFDAFKPTTTSGGVSIPCIAPTATSATATAQLVTNVVRPIVKAAAQSAHADRIAAWEVINEPEWAINGSDPYGDAAFTPASGVTTVTFAQMEAFIQAVVAGIRAETSKYVTVGGAAPKWAKAWTKSNLTLYEWHYYDWINQYWPYTDGPSKYGITLPVVVGELPNSGFTQPSTAPFSTVMNAFYGNGYAGAMGWALTDTGFGAPSTLASFASTNACTTQFTLPGAEATHQRTRMPAGVHPPAAAGLGRFVPSERRCTTAAEGVPVCW